MLRPLTFSIIWGGILAIGLSFILATYYSSSLYAFFHDWTGWRSFTGTSPNTMTEAVRKILWSILFCSCWWMLWRLDIFLGKKTVASLCSSNNAVSGEKSSKFPEDKKTSARGDQSFQKNENFIPEENFEHPEENPSPQENFDCEEKPSNQADTLPPYIPSFEDLQMGKVLGLEKERMNDFAHIKSTYRLAIAQYHPDKVSAMGKEIREVAESKAKDINLAYQYFQNKLKG